MTAFAVDMRRDRVDIVADTALFVPDERGGQKAIGYASKIYPLAHLRALIFGRGFASIIADTALALATAPLGGIEDAAAAMPDILRYAAERLCLLAGIADPDQYMLAEIFMVGWDPRERRMRWWSYASDENFRMVACQDATGIHAIPPIPDIPSTRSSSGSHLVALLKAMQRYYRARPELGGLDIGGELQCWSLTPDGLRMRVAGHLPVEIAPMPAAVDPMAGVPRVEDMIVAGRA